nr:NAD(P)H-hydrate dehydratase [uncultured Desulfobulbus sp.]
MQLALAAQMRELDRQTIEEIGIPGMVLMENAGRGTVDFMQQHHGSVAGKTVCIFAGPGNNGGDGLVIARTVHGLGAFPFVFFLLNPEKLRGDAAENFSIYKQLRLPYQVLDFSEKMLNLADTILTLNRMHPMHSLVDSIFGTGLEREISGHFSDVINCINHLGKSHQMPLVSVDIPSGLHADTGAVLGISVHADLTVTYGLPKPGHYHNGGFGVGCLERVDIGIPTKVVEAMHLQGEVLDVNTANLLQSRRKEAHKGSNGHLLILAGSEGKTGAALLSAQGALRIGTGLVSCGVPKDLNPIFETALAEAMSVVLPASEKALSHEDFPLINELMQDKDALVIGPGIGTDKSTAELVLQLYCDSPLPLVIDADGLNILAAHRDCIRLATGPRIFTPHPGEMARLLDMSIGEIQANRLQAAQWLEEASDCPPLITVLKGAGTVISSNDGHYALNTSGNPGMGTGGMGDVLAGIIGGLLAQRYVPWEAATLGVYLHGLAADFLAQNEPYGYTATEVAQALPRVLGSLMNNKSKEHLC